MSLDLGYPKVYIIIKPKTHHMTVNRVKGTACTGCTPLTFAINLQW